MAYSLELVDLVGPVLGLVGVEVLEAVHEASVRGRTHVHLVLAGGSKVAVVHPERGQEKLSSLSGFVEIDLHT